MNLEEKLKAGQELWLTVTKVVFECESMLPIAAGITGLTVTKVVFECADNRTQFGILVWINSNKGCFWIMRRHGNENYTARLTVTKVVFEFYFVS